MIRLLRLHWEFIRKPSYCLETYIINWPIGLGIAVYAFYSVSGLFITAQGFTVVQAMMTGMWGLSDPVYVYLWLLFMPAYSIAYVYYLMPYTVRLLTRAPARLFDPVPYRKIMLYSGLSYTLFIITIVLPLKVLMTFLAVDGEIGLGAILSMLLMALLAMWLLVPTVNTFVLQWKGMAKFYGLNWLQIILVLFVIPLVISTPLWIWNFQKYLNFMGNYIGT